MAEPVRNQQATVQAATIPVVLVSTRERCRPITTKTMP
jgi:hypothetical protein